MAKSQGRKPTWFFFSFSLRALGRIWHRDDGDPGDPPFSTSFQVSSTQKKCGFSSLVKQYLRVFRSSGEFSEAPVLEIKCFTFLFELSTYEVMRSTGI